MTEPPAAETFDYVVIGSGPGGAPVAANLALAGFRVLVLEAGDEPGGPVYDIPAFHALATEDPALRWDYYVGHRADRQGVWYPRASAVGGCAAHNAMITIAPPDRDWEDIAEVTGDESWRAEHMWRYFQRLEGCRYRSRRFAGDSGHGFDGWLTTETADPQPALRDPELLRLIFAAARTANKEGRGSWLRAMRWFDPNDRRLWRHAAAGIASNPLATRDGRRIGARERLRDVQRRCTNLAIRPRTLATRVVIDGEHRAVGVEYVEGGNLYRAAPEADAALPLPERRTVGALREVIVSAGVFNSPQLLMLSGIGAHDELEKHGIETLVDLPGVGGNLQDHYEISVVSQLKRPLRVLEEARFNPGDDSDPAYREWRAGRGAYTSSGCVMGILCRSSTVASDEVPDLFIFGAPADFRGYRHGYSRVLTEDSRRFTWIVLKARMRTAAGSVRLASADPRCPPKIDFGYFPPGEPCAEQDLDAMLDGVRFVEQMNRRMGERIAARVWPPEQVQTTEQWKQFIRDHAWGHHAACSLPIGRKDDPMAVVDTCFRVHGVQGLRVVDASVFPRIPGYFVSAAIYMIGEKASDVILRDGGAASFGEKG